MCPLGALRTHVVCTPHVFTMCPLGIWPLVPSVGYAAYLDTASDVVYTALDQTMMDHREVVPYNRIEYPARDEVSVH